MQILSRSVSHTQKIAKMMASMFEAGDIICLFGDLGSGKTVFAAGVAAGLGIRKPNIVSPTFVLVKEYAGKEGIPFFHFDFYRLHSPEDILFLGYEEYFYNRGITVIEWPERLGYLLPEEFIKVNLSVAGPRERLISLCGKGKRYQKKMELIYENLKP